MLNIHGHFLSMPTNKVRYCASYLQLPHEYHHVDLTKGEHQSPEYLKLNPAGRVPCIDDGGFMLSQSDAICKYLCGLSGPSSFYPEDLQERALIDQWIDFSSQHILQAIGRVFFNRVIAPMIKQPVDEASITTGLTMLKRDLPTIEAQLSGHEYLAGDKLTLADITLLSCLEPCDIAKIDISDYKSIAQWKKALTARKFYQSIHAHYGAEMQAS